MRGERVTGAISSDNRVGAATVDHTRRTKAGARDDTEFRLFMLMVEKYEAGKYAVPPPDPVAAICFAVEQRGLATADLQNVLSSRQRVHDILRKKRRLTLAQIRSLKQRFRVPAEVLIRDYQLDHSKR